MADATVAGEVGVAERLEGLVGYAVRIPRRIDLHGPMGNAMALVGVARVLALRRGDGRVGAARLCQELTAGSHGQLLERFGQQFGAQVELAQGGGDVEEEPQDLARAVGRCARPGVRCLLNVDGTVELLPGPVAMEALVDLLEVETIDVVALRSLGSPLTALVVDDAGLLREPRRGLNPVASLLYTAQSIPSVYARTIFGRAALVPDEDYAEALGG